MVINEVAAPEPSTMSQFGFTGEPVTVQLPQDATRATIRVWGAGGAGRLGHAYDGNTGGSGGYAETVIDVTPGQ